MKKREKNLKVVFVDDNDDFLVNWRESFRRGAPKTGLDLMENSRNDTKSAVLALDNARLESRTTKKFKFISEAALFNDADLVFVDYDLIELEGTTALTGEDIAYLLRCFTNCGVIVLLNPPDLGTNFFDLRLRRSFDSWADLVLGTDQLDNKWLWGHEPAGFSPWSWPCLIDSVVRREEQVRCVVNAMEDPILDILKFPQDARVAMDHPMAEPVFTRTSGSKTGATRGKMRPYTLREFVFDSGYGIHRRDKIAFQNADNQVTRVGAARLAGWLEHIVLPAQSMLVDAPHLMARLPGLLVGDASKLAAWNATATRHGDGSARAIRATEIADQRFSDQCWLSRPTWYWPLIARDNRYVEWAHVEKMADVAFCEDTSRFVKRSEANEFMADVPPQFALRFVQQPKHSGNNPSPEYRPSVRLTM